MAFQQVRWVLLLSVWMHTATDVRASHGSGDLAERRLRRVLMGHDDYNIRERPVNTSSEPVQVYVKMVMYGLISLNERKQIMKGASWLVVQWDDYRFQWDPAEFADMEFLSLNMDEIWTPKILLTNTANENVENPIHEHTFQVLATHRGVITLEGSIIHETTCLMDLSMFPFDEQECPIQFDTQNMPINLVHLYISQVALDIITKDKFHSQWKPLQLEGDEELRTATDLRSGQLKSFSRLIFTFKVERIPSFYVNNIATPSCILTFITLTVFFLSPESGERIALSVSLMLGQAVFLLVIADALPPTGESPLLSNSMRVNFIVGSMGIVLSVITVSIHHKVGTIKNRFLRKLFMDMLPRLVSLSPPKRKKIGNSSPRRETSESNFTEGGKPKGGWVEIGGTSTAESNISNEEKLSVISDQFGTSSKGPLKEVINPYNGDGDGEMKMLAKTLDRVFFVCTALIFIGGNVKFFIEASVLYH